MLAVWTDTKRNYWRARFFDRRGDEITITLNNASWPVCKKDMPRDEVLSEVGNAVGIEYFHFLHSQGTWSGLAARGNDIKRMYNRLADYHEWYSIENFAYDLEQVGIKPAPAKVVAKTRRRAQRAARNMRQRNMLYEYQGREKTLREWSAECGISPAALRMRITRGWSLKDAMKKPVMSQNESGAIGADRRWSKR